MLFRSSQAAPRSTADRACLVPSAPASVAASASTASAVSSMLGGVPRLPPQPPSSFCVSTSQREPRATASLTQLEDRIAVMNRGRIEQAGKPVEVYGKPASAFVARFFGEVNELRGIVRNRAVATPFGPVSADGHAEAATVQVVIRPEAIRLAPVNETGGEGMRCIAKVMAARLLGRSSWIHLDIGGPSGHGETAHAQHFHARVPGSFLPAENEMLAVSLDPAQACLVLDGTEDVTRPVVIGEEPGDGPGQPGGDVGEGRVLPAGLDTVAGHVHVLRGGAHLARVQEIGRAHV